MGFSSVRRIFLGLFRNGNLAGKIGNLRGAAAGTSARTRIFTGQEMSASSRIGMRMMVPESVSLTVTVNGERKWGAWYFMLVFGKSGSV